MRCAKDHPGQVGPVASEFFERDIVDRLVQLKRARVCTILASNGKLRDKHVHASISIKMEVKRLTADRYPLHFEVWTRNPIGVGKRNGQQHQARYSKAFGWRRRLLSFVERISRSYGAPWSGFGCS